MLEWIIQYWLEVVFGLLLVIFSILFNEIKKLSVIGDSLRVLLKDRILTAYETHIAAGYCSVHDMEHIQDLYKQYKKLNGNGTIENSVMPKLTQLPSEPPTKE